MDRILERSYKRTCFQGRGVVGRWLDRAFFSALAGAGLYILTGKALFALLLAGTALLLLILWDVRRWTRFRRKLWQGAATALKREDWLRKEAASLRQGGGVVLYPTPEGEALMGLCLRYGSGTAFHSFGAEQADLAAQAAALGCSLTVHPWGEGAEPSREQVLERLRRDAPRRTALPWRALLDLPGGRYLLTGCALLLLSMILRRALWWRLLGSACLVIGAIRRSLRIR